METEIWKPIQNWEGIYSVSNFGKIRREKAAQGTTVGSIYKSWISTNGYLTVGLQYKGRSKEATVHSLVALAFLGDRPKNYDINHIDNDKLNNHSKNLEYLTRSSHMNKDGRMYLLHKQSKRAAQMSLKVSIRDPLGRFKTHL